jgi:hypothetical protein
MSETWWLTDEERGLLVAAMQVYIDKLAKPSVHFERALSLLRKIAVTEEIVTIVVRRS